MKEETYLKAHRIKAAIRRNVEEYEETGTLIYNLKKYNKGFLTDLRVSIVRGDVHIASHDGEITMPIRFVLEMCKAAREKNVDEIEKLNKEFEDLKEGDDQ